MGLGSALPAILAQQICPPLVFAAKLQAEGSPDSSAPASNLDRTQHGLRLVFLQGHNVRSRPPLQLVWKNHGEKQHVGV